MKRTISTRAASVGLAAALLASLVAPAAFASTTPTIPAAPSNPTATAVSATAIQVTWADNSNNETGFVVSDSLTSVTLGANTTSYTWGGLTAGTYKCFHVEAYNSAGASAWTGWACATTPTAAQGGQSKRLNVPFISQWNGTNGGGNCGPASLTMILSYYGKSVTFQQAVAAVRLGGPAAPGWTDFESANSVALLQNNGLTYVRTNGAVLNMGSLSAIKAQLDANRPVIMEVWNAYGQNTIIGLNSGTAQWAGNAVFATGTRK